MIRLTLGALGFALILGSMGPESVASARAVAGTATAAVVGPPWISIEYPVNPYDASTRDAFLLVHAFHHGTPMDFPVSGTGEGLVAGQRRSVSLEFSRTSRPGVYALRKQWPNDGMWTLLITVRQGEGTDAGANAVVELNGSNEVLAVRVPTKREGAWLIPQPVAMKDVEARLRARAGELAKR